MSQPTQGDVHVNAPLTDISIAYIQSAAAFVAAQVFPNIPVSKQGDRYYTYERGDFNRDDMKVRSAGSESAGSGYTLDNTPTYYAPVYAFHKDIPDQVRNNSDAVLNPDREATEFVTQKALIRRERIWATNYFDTAKWTYEVAGVDSSPGASEVLQWDDASSDPIHDIRTGIATVLQSTGFKPNTLVLGYFTMLALIDHPDIVDRVKYGVAGQQNISQVGLPELSMLFKIPRIFVMEAIYNTAAELQTNSHAFIGGKHALLCYSAPAPGLMTPSAGYTFSWTGHLGAGAQGGRIKRFRMEPLASDRVEIEMAFDCKKVAADLGYFFYGIVA